MHLHVYKSCVDHLDMRVFARKLNTESKQFYELASRYLYTFVCQYNFTGIGLGMARKL